MARGMITFEFETLADLQAQLMRALGVSAPAGADRTEVPKFCYPQGAELLNTYRGVLGKPGEGMTFTGPGQTTQGPIGPAIEPTIKQVEEQREISKENAAAARTAESINAEVRQANTEAAASMIQAEIEAHIGPKIAAAVSLEGSDKKPDTPVEGAPAADVTLDTLTTVDYSVLLAFCDQHPEVGVVTEKCKPTFFRKLVECKVKTYLETK